MSAARRSSLLAVTFVGLALWLTPSRQAHAQPIRVQPIQPGFRPADPQAGRHSIWTHELSPEQIRAILSKFGQDDGKNDWFEQMLRDAVQKENPNADPKQVDAAIKRLLSDKEFMNRMMDLAQKQKNQMPNNGFRNGPPPNLRPEDLEKLKKLKPEAPDGNPFKVPDRPFPQFDPNRFPKFDPDKFDIDKNTGFPLDKNGRPFDPRTGQPIDPKNPPKIGPNDPRPDPEIPNPNPKGDPQPKVDPPRVIDPNTGRPMDPFNNPDGKRKFDPDNPLGTPNESPERMAKNKAVETATALWEKNVGPIEESPAVKRAIIDLVSDSDAMDALTDGKGNNFFDMLQGDDGDKLGNLFGDSGGTSGWEWPKFDFGWNRGRDIDFDTGSSRPRPRPSYEPRTSGGSSPSLSGFEFGSVHVPWVFLFVLLALIVAAVVWWKWSDIVHPRAVVGSGDGPGPWPIDPRAINTREDVVKAFEYLSVLICGPGAKTWTHSTIADELTALVATHGETAVKLARLYELARYAPLDEPLTRAELLEARRLVCDLAGMDE
jgi:hypothetical protein